LSWEKNVVPAEKQAEKYGLGRKSNKYFLCCNVNLVNFIHGCLKLVQMLVSSRLPFFFLCRALERRRRNNLPKIVGNCSLWHDLMKLEISWARNWNLYYHHHLSLLDHVWSYKSWFDNNYVTLCFWVVEFCTSEMGRLYYFSVDFDPVFVYYTLVVLKILKFPWQRSGIC